MAKVTRDFPDMVGGNRKDRLTVFDSMAEFTDAAQALPRLSRGDADQGNSWNGGDDWDTTAQKCRTGDIGRVAASDAYLSKLERKFSFQSSAFRTIDAVAGGVPNVPAMLANQPLAMRLRKRVQSEQAPLNIVVDITSSGGIGAPELRKRGAALLALVRILSAMRPVSLYVTSAMQSPRTANEFTSSGIAFRVDSAPLDLARAAHALGAVGVARQLLYTMGTCQTSSDNTSSGNLRWPYHDVDFTRTHGVAYWQRILGVDEMLYLPPIYLHDDSISKPEKWLADMIEKYGTPGE